jgi:hypothetical protein
MTDTRCAAFYWHQVTSPEITISVNTFFGDAGESTFVDKMLTTRRDSFLHWIFNVVEQNRSTSAYDVILYHVDHMMKHFAFKQFHEYAVSANGDIDLAN